jgi:hypothetical protein
LRNTQEREAVKSACVNHGFEVLNERLEGKLWDVTIGKTSAALVIPHQRAARWLKRGDHTGLCQSNSM